MCLDIDEKRGEERRREEKRGEERRIEEKRGEERRREKNGQIINLIQIRVVLTRIVMFTVLKSLNCMKCV